MKSCGLQPRTPHLDEVFDDPVCDTDLVSQPLGMRCESIRRRAAHNFDQHVRDGLLLEVLGDYILSQSIGESAALGADLEDERHGPCAA